MLRRVGSPRASIPLEPCLSTGPIVREDGSVGPCCSGLAYERRGKHPFDFGNAGSDGLAACRERWAQDPLLRLLRVVGFAVPLQWLVESGDPTLIPAGVPQKTCELCVQLWDEDGRVGRFLRERASTPEVVAQLDLLEQTLFS
jgi:hypothetical protein